jgi:hypothetical protein
MIASEIFKRRSTSHSVCGQRARWAARAGATVGSEGRGQAVL